MDQEIVQRGDGGKWLPGASPNPGGRPKTAKEVVELAREHAPEMIELLREIANDPKTGAMARVKAIEIMLNRAYGVPAPIRDPDAAGGGEPVTFFFKLGDGDSRLEAIVDGEVIEEGELAALAEEAGAA